MTTNQGNIGLQLDNAKAPCTVNSFASLAQQGYFNDTPCHRLTTSPGLSVLQCGDPTGQGTGGPGYGFANEYPTNQYRPDDPALQQPVVYPRGTLAMANAGARATNGSQFFLVYKDSQLPPNYTAFGTIDATGLATLDKIAAAGVDPATGEPTTASPKTPSRSSRSSWTDARPAPTRVTNPPPSTGSTRRPPPPYPADHGPIRLPGYPGYRSSRRRHRTSMAIASLVCAFLFFPLGIVFGHMSLSQIKKSRRGRARARDRRAGRSATWWRSLTVIARRLHHRVRRPSWSASPSDFDGESGLPRLRRTSPAPDRTAPLPPFKPPATSAPTASTRRPPRQPASPSIRRAAGRGADHPGDGPRRRSPPTAGSSASNSTTARRRAPSTTSSAWRSRGSSTTPRATG